MKRRRPVAALIIALLLPGLGFVLSCVSRDWRTTTREPDLTPYESKIWRIAESIELLKTDYPQLADFSARSHCDRGMLAIKYGYSTHPAHRLGGWTSGVPNPNKDGVWFYIDFHDPGSQRQIHTQPIVPRYRYKDKEVMFLILEGEQTESIRAAVSKILRDNGVQSSDGRQ
jgi:hypothetical protein